MSATMSFVEVSPSTVTMLKVPGMSSLSAFASIAGLMAQSEVMKPSIVAILGQIMPLPLAMQPMRHSTPPAVKLTAISLLCVSVVIIASAAGALSAPRAFTSSGIPRSKGSMLMAWPMTPVEATMTSSGAMPSSAASRAQVVSAMYSPFALQVFALPLLQIIALAKPSARCLFVTVSGAPLTRFCVYTAAAAARFSEYMSARSRFVRFLRTPQYTPAAL